jgi:hypothetical protein
MKHEKSAQRAFGRVERIRVRASCASGSCCMQVVVDLRSSDQYVYIQGQKGSNKKLDLKNLVVVV